MSTPTNPHADELLIVRCQLGERAAFDALIRRWSTPLQRYAMKLTHDATLSDDLVQDIWLRVLRGLARLRDPRSFAPGCSASRIAPSPTVCVIATRCRSMPRSIPTRSPPTLMTATTPSIGLALASGMEHLPLVEREVLTLFYSKISLADIAAALAIPAGTVKSRLFRARALLRRHLTTAEP